MLFGFVKDGEAVFEEHLGQRRSHSKASVQHVTAHALRLDEEAGLVIMEVQLPLDVLQTNPLPNGEFPYILAFGPQANFTAYHSWRTSAVWD